jgi:hypothetical protein
LIFKDEVRDLRTQVDKLDDENRRLRKELKEAVKNQFDDLDTNFSISQINDTLLSHANGSVDNDLLRNLEKQLSLSKQVRETSCQF